MPCKPSGALCPDQKIADKEDKEIKMDEGCVSRRALCPYRGIEDKDKEKSALCTTDPWLR